MSIGHFFMMGALVLFAIAGFDPTWFPGIKAVAFGLFCLTLGILLLPVNYWNRPPGT